jgi:hypothetical protein
MRALSLPLFGLAVELGASSCSHANRPCPPQRPFARRTPTLAPTDSTNAAACGCVQDACAWFTTK